MDQATFDAALAAYLQALQEQADRDYATGVVTPPRYETMVGPKYVRLVRVETCGSSRSAFAFVCKATGAIYKPAGWKGPAKGARGNIAYAHARPLTIGGLYR